MRPVARRDLALHLARLSVLTVLMVVSARFCLFAATPFAVLLFLAAFAMTHDTTHGALRIPGRLNEIALSLSAAVMLMSGHALRRSHLEHHKHPLADGDIEGEAARYPFHVALLLSPRTTIRWTTESYRLAHPRERRAIVVETFATTAITVLLLVTGSAVCQLYVATALTMRLFMGVWASNLTHRTPHWLVACARPFEKLGSVLAKSLVHHELHHRRPAIPCARLAAEC
jgi:fatty acid desaturase